MVVAVALLQRNSVGEWPRWGKAAADEQSRWYSNGGYNRHRMSKI